MFENYQIFLKINTDLLTNPKYENSKLDSTLVIKKPYDANSSSNESNNNKTPTYDSFFNNFEHLGIYKTTNLEKQYSQPYSLNPPEFQKKEEKSLYFQHSKVQNSSNSSQLFKDYFFKNNNLNK